jgi:uncharacterized membrane protein (UPF0127 family)
MSFSNYKKIKTKIKGKPGTYSLWVADTPKKRSTGLSKIRSLPKNKGMIFVYDDDAPRSFTMKNTFIPLQIIFLDKNFNILSQEKGRPRQASPIICKGKCRYVVEISG